MTYTFMLLSNSSEDKGIIVTTDDSLIYDGIKNFVNYTQGLSIMACDENIRMCDIYISTKTTINHSYYDRISGKMIEQCEVDEILNNVYLTLKKIQE